MIHQQLHRQPTAIERDKHRTTRVQLPVTDWSLAAKMNSLFVAAVEFGDACREYPFVFVGAGNENDKPLVAPVTVFGLGADENLYFEGGQWRASYLPALMRMYPFCLARVGDDQYAVCADASWGGLQDGQGQALFDGEGKPSPLLEQVQKGLEQFEREAHRTKLVGAKLLEHDLLRDMRFDAKLADGRSFSVDGFFTVDEARLNALPDAALLDLQRSGVLGLIHAHMISLGNMRRLVDWRAQRMAAAAAS